LFNYNITPLLKKEKGVVENPIKNVENPFVVDIIILFFY